MTFRDLNLKKPLWNALDFEQINSKKNIRSKSLHSTILLVISKAIWE